MVAFSTTLLNRAPIDPFKGHYTAGAFAAFAVAALALVVAWWLLNRLSPFDDNKEMFEKKNTGFTVIRAFQIVGLAYALAPVIAYTTTPWWQQVVWAAIDAVWAILILFVAGQIIVKLVERTHGARLNAIRHSRPQLGLVLGVFYVAFGLVLGATLPGPSSMGLAETFAISLAFSLLGMVYIMVAYLAVARIPMFGRAHLGLNSYIRAEGNWAAAILAAVLVWDFGVVTSSAVSGAFTGWTNSIVTFAVAAVIMVALTIATIWTVDRLVVTNATIHSIVGENRLHPMIVALGFVAAVSLFASYVAS